MPYRLSQTRREAQGQRLQKARTLAEYSVREVAEKLGIGQATVRHWEAGSVPMGSARRQLADLYGFEESRLFAELFEARADIQRDLGDYAFDPELTRQRLRAYGPPWIYVTSRLVHLSTEYLLPLRKYICGGDFEANDEPRRPTGIGDLATCARCRGRSEVVSELVRASFGGTDPRSETESL